MRFLSWATLVWLSYAVWHSIKPVPLGTRVASLPARLSESQVDLIGSDGRSGSVLAREFDIIARAEQTVVLDQSPVAAELADRLLARKHQRPNLKVLLVTDPRGEIYGGTPAMTLAALEQAGIVVVRVKLDHLRDCDPLYSSAWRLLVAWWDDPYDAVGGRVTLLSELRNRNLKADRRQLLVADDGAGGWISLVASGFQAARNLGVEIRGSMARNIVASELRIAAWSSDDDRLPSAPPIEPRGVGAIDARLVTEGAIQAALRDALAVMKPGDAVRISASGFGDRTLMASLARAAAHGVRLQLLLDPDAPGARAAAGELRRETGAIEVRWQTAGGRMPPSYAVMQHGGDVWLDLGSADFTRHSLDDLNLAADVELHLPARASAARMLLERFALDWAQGTAYATHADEGTGTYWRYRLAEVTGSAIF